MSNAVRYYHWQMPGAPTLNRVAGSLIDVLDACLINGFNTRSVSSLVISSNVATVTTTVAHGYEVDTVVRVSGASPSALNNDHRVLTVPTSTTFTFDVTGLANQTATGTISTILAPAGWSKPFNATNIGVYRSQNVTSTQFYLRVDDSGVALTDARVVGYESMTDVNTGVDPFPTNAQVSGGAYWPKANSGTASDARAWAIVADDRMFYYWCHTITSTSVQGRAGVVQGFGDFTSVNSADAFACALAGFTSAQGDIVSLNAPYSTPLVDATWVARPHTGFAGATGLRPSPIAPSVSSRSGSDGFVFPNPADNGLLLSPVSCVQPSPNLVLRGTYRGLRWMPHSIPDTNFYTLTKIVGTGPLLGKKFMTFKDSSPASSSSTSTVIALDILGPWD
jgi:hypothetical protein